MSMILLAMMAYLILGAIFRFLSLGEEEFDKDKAPELLTAWRLVLVWPKLLWSKRS